MSAVIEARLTALEARMAAAEARLGSGGSSTSGPRGVASDDDLDSEYGDEVIKKDPKKWVEQGGESYAGCKMSECPPEYLRMLASLFDWMAGKDEESGKTYKNKQGKDVPVAPLNRKKAARARGWANRNETRGDSGGAPKQQSLASAVTDDDIPF